MVFIVSSNVESRKFKSVELSTQESVSEDSKGSYLCEIDGNRSPSLCGGVSA